MNKYTQQFFAIYNEKLERLNDWLEGTETEEQIMRCIQILYSEAVDDFFALNDEKIPWKKFRKYEKTIQEITKEQESFPETVVTASVVLGDLMQKIKNGEI